MSNRVIRGLRCPACGGAVELTEGIDLIDCSSCQQSLLIRGETGSPRYYVPNELSEDEAAELVKGWLRSGIDKARDLRDQAEVCETFLAWIPFWRVKAQIVGWIFGTERRTTGSGKNRRTTYVNVERVVLHKADSNLPATEVQEFGVQTVCLEGDELRPLDLEKLEEDGTVFRALLPQDEALEQCREGFLAQAQQLAKVDTVSFKRLDFTSCEVSQVYYPLWVVRYRYRERTYQCVVDGEGKKVLYGRAPGNDLYRAAALVLSSAVASVMLTSGLRATPSLASSDGNLELPFVILALWVVLIGWGFQKFRHGGEVILSVGEPFKVPRRRNLGRSAGSALGKAFKAVQDQMEKRS